MAARGMEELAGIGKREAAMDSWTTFRCREWCRRERGHKVISTRCTVPGGQAGDYPEAD